jgi:hypothetical protein
MTMKGSIQCSNTVFEYRCKFLVTELEVAETKARGYYELPVVSVLNQILWP